MLYMPIAYLSKIICYWNISNQKISVTSNNFRKKFAIDHSQLMYLQITCRIIVFYWFFIFCFLEQIVCDLLELALESNLYLCIHFSESHKTLLKFGATKAIFEQIYFTCILYYCSHVLLDICTPTLGKSLYVALCVTEVCKYC